MHVLTRACVCVCVRQRKQERIRERRERQGGKRREKERKGRLGGKERRTRESKGGEDNSEGRRDNQLRSPPPTKPLSTLCQYQNY